MTLSCLLCCTITWTRLRPVRHFPIGVTGRTTAHNSLFAAAHLPPSCTYDGHHFSDESEAAHWGLFLNNFTRHVLDTYGAPDKWSLSAQARSVAAFLFGLRSHQVRGGHVRELTEIHTRVAIGAVDGI